MGAGWNSCVPQDAKNLFTDCTALVANTMPDSQVTKLGSISEGTWAGLWHI
jgi:hypothetical protein